MLAEQAEEEEKNRLQAILEAEEAEKNLEKEE